MDFKYDITIDSISSNGAFSVKRQRYLMLDGVRQDVGLPERRAFTPGELDQLEAFAPDAPQITAVATALWTPEVIAAWQEAHREPVFEPEPGENNGTTI